MRKYKMLDNVGLALIQSGKLPDNRLLELAYKCDSPCMWDAVSFLLELSSEKMIEILKNAYNWNLLDYILQFLDLSAEQLMELGRSYEGIPNNSIMWGHIVTSNKLSAEHLVVARQALRQLGKSYSE